MRVIELFIVLSNEYRVRIFNLLNKSQLTLFEIHNILKLRKSVVFRHLSILKAAEIIEIQSEAGCGSYNISKKFIQDNSRLYDYIIKIISIDTVYVLDVKRLENQKKDYQNKNK